jgi:hypothetical protein
VRTNTRINGRTWQPNTSRTGLNTAQVEGRVLGKPGVIWVVVVFRIMEKWKRLCVNDGKSHSQICTATKRLNSCQMGQRQKYALEYVENNKKSV